MLPLELLSAPETPFYFYDLGLFRRTLRAARKAAAKYPAFRLHYAVKANVDPIILTAAKEEGVGADVVSGGELRAVAKAGFQPDSIVFAGVGKSDKEINLALDMNIGCFNVESIAELEVINEIAASKGNVAPVALRVNPNIDAHTHHFITTGLQDNKFGINLDLLDQAVELAETLPAVDLIGLHFHIGSQITINYPFELLCERVNHITSDLRSRGIELNCINLGGGLGIDYDNPDVNPIPDFAGLFDTVGRTLDIRQGQTVHFELGRSLVAQCGSLISRVLYIKEGHSRRFAIIDAGMSELIRPALYQASHAIENLSALARGESRYLPYDVVGPICETSDSFGEGVVLPVTARGDIIAIRSAGAYGEAMASHYNCRYLNQSYYHQTTETP